MAKPAEILLLLLLLYTLRPPSWWQSARPSSGLSLASASAVTASWTTVWVDEFENEEVDETKWELPERVLVDSERPTSSAAAAAAGGGRQMEDADDSNRSTQGPSSTQQLQVHIGAHDNLVMVAAAAPRPPQSPGTSDQDSAGAGAGAGPAEMHARSRISTAHFADFTYGRVEVRAKVAPDGFSGFWLRPSEEGVAGHTPCARVAIAEFRASEDDAGKNPVPSSTASIQFGDFEESRWGCTNSSVWPREGGGCSLPTEAGVGADWSAGFHVYALEWEEDEIRWYVDGRHYCTKSFWFARHPDDFPAPFNKAFHVEMGIEVAAWSGSGGRDEDAWSPPDTLPEMLVDYVRIAQGPSGRWGPSAGATAGDGFPLAADEGLASPPPRAIDILMNAIALCACVLGPYMAMTGLSRPLTNTVLMGIEIGAFKAANASYLFSGSYTMALFAAVTFGLLVGFLAVRHRAMARWNTVAGLAVPVLFLLIDVGMIADIGSRYVCWAIFFVLTVTFAVLVFPSQHHIIGFAVACAATGGCVLKLGLGWLLGESGEIFKILDDPLGDRCHVSRVCQYLNFVSGAMFLIGLCSQKYLGPYAKDEVVYGGGGGAFGGSSLEKRRRALFTPPRTRSTGGGGEAVALPSSKPVTRSSTGSTSSDFEVEGSRGASVSGERQPAFCVVDDEQGGAGDEHGRDLENDDDDAREYDEDEAFILGIGGGKRRSGGGVWQRAAAGARGILDGVLHPISSYRRHQVPVSVPPDSPTPVPMPPTGAGSNTVVSNQGDTIELVIHSPHKGAVKHARPPGWLGGIDGGGGGGGNGVRSHQSLPPLSLKQGGDGKENERGHRHQATTATSAPSSIDYDDILSILSASELVTDDLPAATSGPPGAAANIDRASSGRLADAFSEKWGAWVQEARSSDDEVATGGEGGEPKHEGSGRARSASEQEGSSGGGRSAGEVDHEALELNPFESGLGAAAIESEDDNDGRILSRSSSESVYDEKKWLWRRRDGVLPSMSSSGSNSTRDSSRRGSILEGGPENTPNQPLVHEGVNACNGGAVGVETSGRRICAGGDMELGADTTIGDMGLDREIKQEEASAPRHLQGQGQATRGDSTTPSLLEVDI